jgi:GntR family transcriptional regulator
MFLHIERGSSTPISRQIAEQIAALCAAGSLKVGDRLPSVRQLAHELTVNQNTVLRVYERLAADGLLEMRHGEGTFVAGNASRRRFEKQRRQFVDELGLVVRRGLMLGMSPDEVRQLCDEALEANAELAPSIPIASSATGG